jgi:p-aminobenzoyl-glutamate transporter AbgT
VVHWFVLALVALAATAVLALPPLGALVFIHHRTHSVAAFWAWFAGLLIYAAAVGVALMSLIVSAGLVAWAGS